MEFNFTSDTKRLICLATLLGIYLLSGAAVFQVLENETDKLEIQQLNSVKRYFLSRHNMTSEDFDFLVEKVENAVKHRCGSDPNQWCTSRWSYYASVYFTWSVVTTVGYGHLAPSTVGGRVFCMVFALFGIPLNLMVLRHIGDRVNQFINYLHYQVETKLLRREGKVVTTKTLAWTLLVLVLMLFVGAFLYSQTEHWSFLEGVYFCFITFSTIGFGDLVPNGGQAPTGAESVTMEILRALVVLLGVSMFFSIITSVLTASEELRVNFPSAKYLGGSDKTAPDSPDSKERETSQENILEDLESGSLDSFQQTKERKTVGLTEESENSIEGDTNAQIKEGPKDLESGSVDDQFQQTKEVKTVALTEESENSKDDLNAPINEENALKDFETGTVNFSEQNEEKASVASIHEANNRERGDTNASMNGHARTSLESGTADSSEQNLKNSVVPSMQDSIKSVERDSNARVTDKEGK